MGKECKPQWKEDVLVLPNQVKDFATLVLNKELENLC